MAIKNVGDEWTSVVLTNDEVWVVNSGEVLISTDASANRSGARIMALQAVSLQTGQTVFYKRGVKSYTEIERVGFTG